MGTQLGRGRPRKDPAKVKRFAQNLVRICEKEGISRTELARIIGVEYQAVCQWFRAETMPTDARLTQVAEALNTTRKELLK